MFPHSNVLILASLWGNAVLAAHEKLPLSFYFRITSILRAIAEGRQLFRNLQHSFQYILLMHIPLAITAIFISLMGYPILYLPIHIVWHEIIIHPTALLVFQELLVQGPNKLCLRKQRGY